MRPYISATGIVSPLLVFPCGASLYNRRSTHLLNVS